MASLTPKNIAELHNHYGKPVTIDDVIRLRGRDEVQSPILAYPKSESLTDYEMFSGKDLDRFVDQGCWTLIERGFKANDEKIVALYGESDLCFSVTMMSLLRLGCKVMTVSIRLGPLACRSLLDRVECHTIIYGILPRLRSTLDEIALERLDTSLYPMLIRSDFDKPAAKGQPFVRAILDEDAEQRRIALIMHSSGSTGYPKPLFQCHGGILLDILTGMGCRAFNPLPWFHLHGLLTSLQSMYKRKTAYLWNARLPLTAVNIITAVRAIQPEIFHGVPYTVKLVSEVSEGIELLKCCKYVTSGGARPPDELGNKLVSSGVHFSTTFGLTETGHIGDSMRRQPGDDDWDYLRLHSFVVPHIIFRKIEDGKDANTYEAVFLKSHPALMMSNSEDPPGSYHSGDIFIPHPTLLNAWKYIARNDDCITLANGEKINPMAMEGVLRQHHLTRDALMFGIDQSHPGMMIFKSQSANDMSDEEYMAAISDALAEANGFADDFARVIPDMVILVAPEVDYPVTDKNNIIRAAAYRVFQDQIHAAYDTLDNNKSNSRAKLKLEIPELEQYILDQFTDHVEVHLRGLEDDFFSAGVDSLLAIQIRRNIQRDVDIGDSNLPTNIVYDARTVSRLARQLHSMRARAAFSGHKTCDAEDQSVAEMESLIERYGTFGLHARSTQPAPREDVVILTGATGALGAHMLRILLQRSSVRHVYCLVRGQSTPRDRVMKSLLERGINFADMNPEHLDKFSAHHTSSFGAKHLGLSFELYSQLRSQTTLIVHAAWPVHFKLPLASFETHIAGVKNLLQLTLEVPWKEPARFLFASSIATAYATPRLADGATSIVAEGPIPSLLHCLGTGYAQSKLVCERICAQAANTGAKVAILRIGQFVGDIEKGIWNPKEAIPLMVHSALIIHALPILDGEKDVCNWMPINTMAEACLQVDDDLVSRPCVTNGQSDDIVNTNFTNNRAIYYNLVSPHSHSWSADVLPALRKAGLNFDEVSIETWLSKVRNHSANTSADTEKELPAMKLLDYYEDLYGRTAGRISMTRFDISIASENLSAMRNCPNVIETGLTAKFLDVWLRQWIR